MSNSVVKVTDSMLSDSLLLLVGEDGTVSPNKGIVETYLNGKSTSTNLQIMHISKANDKEVEVAVDSMVYVPDFESKCIEENSNFNQCDEIGLNLYNIKLDHDYTPHLEPPQEVDDLVKTLTILDGDQGLENINNPFEGLKDKACNKVVDALTGDLFINNCITKEEPQNVEVEKLKPVLKKNKSKAKLMSETVKESQDDCGDDSNSEWDENKQQKLKKGTKQELKNKCFKEKLKSQKLLKNTKDDEELSKLEKLPLSVNLSESKCIDKRQLKKDKKNVKPAPEEFALFSTPDIIRRVGGKESNALQTLPSLSTELSGTDLKPAKIEIRSRSVTEPTQISSKYTRLSLDSRVIDKFEKLDAKTKDKKSHFSDKIKKNYSESVLKKSPEISEQNNCTSQSKGGRDNIMDDAKFTNLNIENKSFNSSLSLESHDIGNSDSNTPLDGSGLDIDPSLLENINNDLISEDLLYQVAQSLVSNTELQNAIDRSLNEDNLELDSTDDVGVAQKQEKNVAPENTEKDVSSMVQSGTQIVRPDGRIVVIPPIERPATRSRNKKQEMERQTKFHPKPLDEEHVSGNEFDSSEDEEEESEDDPNKLWCICNQPHNNRFMICCDTCEEWYHGKCVNITKAMGQQMESEGKEWICLFCKDPLLKRPQAAARRIRKASRNSSDSAGSIKIHEVNTGSVPCVVCQKPSRTNSIFCSETCILAHAQGVERVVVFERSTGNMLTGNKAPSAANLEQWLKGHPGYEVVRSAGKIVTTKTHNVTHSKLKFIKSTNTVVSSQKRDQDCASKSLSKNQQQDVKTASKSNLSEVKSVDKNIVTPQSKKTLPRLSPTQSAMSASSKAKILHPPIKSCTNHISKEKPSLIKQSKPRQVEQISTTSQNKQENIRENVQKTIFEQLTNRLKIVDDLTVPEDELKCISKEIEIQLHKCFGDTGQKYRNKYRSLIFNIKDIKNQTLWRRICEKSVNPYQLVRLSPDDLASQELALWREREAKHQLDMIKKSELELLKCNRQYVLKTHKGEQILEDTHTTDNIDSSEVITSLTDENDIDKNEPHSLKDIERKNSRHSYKDKERDRKYIKSKSESKDHRKHRTSSKDHDRNHKRSRSRDRSSKNTDRKRSRSRDKDRHRRSSHKSSRHKKGSHRGSSSEKLDRKSKEILEQLVDNKIVPPLEDRLWKHVSQEDIVPNSVVESDSDHEPSSTVTIPTPPHNIESDEYYSQNSSAIVKSDKTSVEKGTTELEYRRSPEPRQKPEEIWRGVINMIDVAQISITAHEVSGDCSGLESELPTNLDIVGRISPETVWDYIGKMKCSNSKIISVVRLNAINVEEKMPYLALYSYLSSRNRLGVVKSTNRAVKDFYILPLAPQKPIPQALLPINGPGFEEARPALLLGILVRDKRKRPVTDSVVSIITNVKKTKTEPLVQGTPPSRSYTPPPIKDPRIKAAFTIQPTDKDEDEPYSPEDSDQDNGLSSARSRTNVTSAVPPFLDSSASTSQTFEPFSNKFGDIPGLDNTTIPINTQEIQRQMEKLNKEIEMQKSEINSISQNIATASTEIGTSALANIALPSNLQQILDSIKTIGSVSSTLDSLEIKPAMSTTEASDFTIPLMLPTTFSRQLSNLTSPTNTIPLNLPSRKKSSEQDKSNSVLSSLSEEDLIRKAEEMLEGSNNSQAIISTSGAQTHCSPNSSVAEVDVDHSPITEL